MVVTFDLVVTFDSVVTSAAQPQPANTKSPPPPHPTRYSPSPTSITPPRSHPTLRPPCPQLIPGCPYFASKVKLGPQGVEEILGLGNLADFERQQLDGLVPALVADIEKVRARRDVM